MKYIGKTVGIIICDNTRAESRWPINAAHDADYILITKVMDKPILAFQINSFESFLSQKLCAVIRASDRRQRSDITRAKRSRRN